MRGRQIWRAPAVSEFSAQFTRAAENFLHVLSAFDRSVQDLHAAILDTAAFEHTDFKLHSHCIVVATLRLGALGDPGDPDHPDPPVRILMSPVRPPVVPDTVDPPFHDRRH
jgi:hypothetical protein